MLAKCFGCLALTFVASIASAGTISIQLDYGQFGHVANAGPLCAPTSVANSFQYLVNRYPVLYGGTELIRGDVTTTRNELAGGWVTAGGQFRTGMSPQGGSAPTCGASDQSWWETKVQWIEDFAPGTTTLAGMLDADPTGWLKGSSLTNAVPTFDFLWRELAANEDVEIGIQLPNSRHAVTLTSLTFEDDNGNGQWDTAREFASIDYIDPNCPLGRDKDHPRSTIAGLTLGADGRLHFPWVNGDGSTCDPNITPPVDASIRLAYAESPVPEPATIVLLGIGIGAAAAARKRSRRRQES